jgi:dTDP-4-dehydrorhamnose 3,5-epimerase
LKNDKGIGGVIVDPQDPKGLLIAGVKIEPAALYPDDRGYFMEIARFGQKLVSAFPAATTQISCALTYPGAIKAFHFHREQTDVWAPAAGMFQVGLVDLRPDSPTYGQRNTIYAGALRAWHILIPPGVGHGYKVLGETAGVLVYATDRIYNPADEGRIAHNHAGINYDWELQHK